MVLKHSDNNNLNNNYVAKSTLVEDCVKAETI
jgi:hypothetical protein